MRNRLNNSFENTLLVLMSVGFLSVSYQLLKINPVFMDSTPLFEKLRENQETSLAVPEANDHTLFDEDDIEPITLPYFHSSRNYVHNRKKALSQKYKWLPTRQPPEAIREEKNHTHLNFAVDETAFYINTPSKLVATNHQRKILWEYHPFKPVLIGAPLVTKKSLYQVTSQGQVFRFNKKTGELIWLLPLFETVLQTPVLYRDALFLLTRKEHLHFIYKIHGHTGRVIWKKPLYKFTFPHALTVNGNKNLILITDPAGLLLALDANSGNAYWQKKSLGTLEYPVMANGQFAYLANAEGQAFSFNLTNKALTWEYTLDAGVTSNFSYVPEHRQVCVQTMTNTLYCIKALSGEMAWSYKFSNNRISSQIFSARLKTRSKRRRRRRRLSPAGEQGDWMLWSPCSTEQICIFAPDTGKIATRIKLQRPFWQRSKQSRSWSSSSTDPEKSIFTGPLFVLENKLFAVFGTKEFLDTLEGSVFSGSDEESPSPQKGTPTQWIEVFKSR